MKKWMIGILSATFILGAGTLALAQENSDGGKLNFGQMKPNMEKMHPDLSDKQLKDMYQSCHGANNSMSGKNAGNMSDMMNSF